RNLLPRMKIYQRNRSHNNPIKRFIQALQPISNIQKYQQLYYSLERSVDNNLYRIMKTIMKSSMYKDTIIIFTSDHGEQLGAHGLFQKWHNIYEESIHVPLIIHSPALFSGYTATNELT